MNIDHDIKPETVAAMLRVKPSVPLKEQAPHLQSLAQFVLRYVMCIVNKESFLEDIKLEQLAAYKLNPDFNKMNKFKCPLDFFTNMDCAMVWFQYVNHNKEWREKKASIAAQSKRVSYTCNLKFTASKGGRKMDGSSTTDKGMKLYKGVETFVVELK